MEMIKEASSKVSKNNKVSKIATVNVENVPCYCSIGVHDEEKKMGQKLLVDAYVDIDLSKAINSDNILDALSYVDVYKCIQRIGQSKSHSLIEVIADKVAETLLEYPLVVKARVRIHKPHIPFPEFHGDVSVEVERNK